MKKRGQITVFIVLGVVVVVLAGLVYYTRSTLTKEGVGSTLKKTTKAAFDVAPVKKYAESCLKRVSDKGLWIIGEHGGYIDPGGNDDYGEEGVSLSSPIPPTTYGGKKIPYYLEDDFSYFLTLDDIEEKLSRYIIVEFEKCLSSDVLEELGFDVTRPNVNYTDINFDFDNVSVDSEVSINVDSVTVQVEYPLTVRGGDVETRLNEFRVNLPIRLGRIYNASVNEANPIGLLVDIRNEWSDADTDAYNLSKFDCDLYDPLKQINIYIGDNDNDDADTKIIQFVDYNPFYYKYQKAYTFQVAIKRDPIGLTEDDMCSGSY